MKNRIMPLHYSSTIINDALLNNDLILVPSRRIKKVLLDSLDQLNRPVLKAPPIQTFQDYLHQCHEQLYLTGTETMAIARRDLEQRLVKSWLSSHDDWTFINSDGAAREILKACDLLAEKNVSLDALPKGQMNETDLLIEAVSYLIKRLLEMGMSPSFTLAQRIDEHIQQGQVDLPKSLILFGFDTLIEPIQHFSERCRVAGGEVKECVPSVDDATCVRATLPLAKGLEPEKSHERMTWSLARAVIDRDETQGWDLLNNPNRLKISTIDAFCLSLAKRLPLLSGIGGVPKINDHPNLFYHEAVEGLWTIASQDPQLRAHMQTLLKHTGNNWQSLADFIVNLLGKRIQWMRYVVAMSNANDMHAALSETLADVCERELMEYLSYFSVADRQEFLDLAEHMKQVVDILGLEKHPLLDIDVPALNELELRTSIPFIQAFISCLLTGKDEFRKSVNKTLGFPTVKDSPSDKKDEWSANKDAMNALLTRLSGDPEALDLLKRLNRLPKDLYYDSQLEVIEALVYVLHCSVAQLKTTFSAHNEIDFAEVGLMAIDALGHDEAPSDLALILDASIRHILIDEFQDTNMLQLSLLEQLTKEWLPDEGKTVFLVGDPMQSIYRFRQADVSIFLKLCETSLPTVLLNSVTLEQNFRSSEVIVDWNNKTYQQVFPSQSNTQLDAVTYSNSRAFHEAQSSDKVESHLFAGDHNQRDQAFFIADKVIEHLNANKAYPEGEKNKLAILVRNKNDASLIIEQLNRLGISFKANEIFRLDQQQLTQDLYAILKVLIDTTDDISLYALIRSPFVGFTLQQMFQLNQAVGKQSLMAVLFSPDGLDALEGLDATARAKLKGLSEIIRTAKDQRTQKPFKKWFESVLQALGVFELYTQNSEINDINALVELFVQHLSGSMLQDPAVLIEALSKKFASPDPQATDEVQIMTMHKSKGLEFDTVVIPSLDKAIKGPDQDLIMWESILNEDNFYELLVGIKPPKGANEKDPIYRYLLELEKARSNNELDRLLYVATTRAKSRLILTGLVEHDENEGQLTITPPSKNKVLYKLWSALESSAMIHWSDQSSSAPDQEPRQFIKRLNAFPVESLKSLPDAEPHEVYSLASKSDSLLGQAIHKALEFVEDNQFTGSIERICRQYGLFAPHYHQKVESAIRQTLDDPDGQWILRHRGSSENELELHAFKDGFRSTHIIDRTFIEDGVRWVIDYKTSEFKEGQSEKAFIEQEIRLYKGQLARYQAALKKFGSEPVRTGLYFTSLGRWEIVN